VFFAQAGLDLDPPAYASGLTGITGVSPIPSLLVVLGVLLLPPE
jgi:hypothetical protein